MTDTPVQSSRVWQWIERITGLENIFRFLPNPVFRLELKHTKWLQPDPRRNLRAAMNASIRVSLFILIMTTIFDMAYRLSATYRSQTLPSTFVVIAAVLLSLLLIIVGDFYYLAQSLNGLAQERESGSWEMVRLILLDPKTILDAKYAAIQLRCWRVLISELTLRFYLCVAIIPAILIRGALDANTITFCIYGIGACLAYFLEAQWRMRMTVAIGMALSSRSQSSTINFLMGFLALVGLHIVQIAIIGVTGLLTFSLAATELQYPNISFNFQALAIHPFLVLPLLFAVCRYVQNFAYNSALRYAFRDV